MKPQTALISVYDKTGIVDFARALHDEFGIEIISTGGTAMTLRDAGIPVTLVEEITGFPEMMNGRVKTLHPKIHAGILADRDNPAHMRQLEEHGIKPIDIVVVNLYPFEKTIADPDCTFEQAIEMIDIGGPSMLRAAAKNHKHVWPISDVSTYGFLLKHLRGKERFSQMPETFLSDLAMYGFIKTADYDAKISSWLSTSDSKELMRTQSLRLWAYDQSLRYGENPMQHGSVWKYAELENLLPFQNADYVGQMSYNNYVDADAALALCADLSRELTQQCGGPALSRSISEVGVERSSGPSEVGDRLSAGQSSKMGDRLSAGQSSKMGDPLSAGQSRTITDEQVHRRHLPHIQRPDASYFVTFRLKSGTLSGNERDIVAESLLYGDALGQYALHGAIVMPDHVHLLLTPLQEKPNKWVSLGVILKGIKGSTARRINECRKASGAVWQDEYWDTIVRDAQHLSEAVEYLVQNAERAALASDSAEYAWCLIDPAVAWNSYSRQAGVAQVFSLQVGRAPEVAAVRSWHHLLSNRQR